MTSNWLLAEMEKAKVRRLSEYEKLKTPDQIACWQKDRKEFFLRQLGPLWEKTPLNARITGTLNKSKYRIEKIVFESLPNFYITATVFLPPVDKYPQPRPAVLHVCGHSENGKASERYQRIAILGAMNGLIVLSMDPIEQGERIQHRDQGKPYQSSSRRHDLLGPDCILVGRNAATYFIWDMMRALDYLQSRPDVDPNRLGVLGNSGGGTQSSYIMALDDRIQAAAPCCYNCSLYGQLIRTLGPQDMEQCIFGQAEFGMDHPDYSIMRCPKPTLLCCATQDYFPIEDTWNTFRQAKRIYTRLHMSNRMELAEMEGPHGYHPELREAGISWMLRWLDHRDIAVHDDPGISILSNEEIRSLPEPGIASLPHARRTHDFNRDLARQHERTRRDQWKKITDQKAADLVRRTAGIRAIFDLPVPVCHSVPGSSTEFVLETDKGIFLPIRFNRIPVRGEEIQLCVSDSGTLSVRSNDPVIEQNCKCVAVVNVRACGETKPVKIKYHYDEAVFGPEGYEYSLAFLLGKSMIGMRAEDLIESARFLKLKYPGSKISLYARENMRITALHAAIAEQKLFDSVVMEDPESIEKYRDYVEKSPAPVPIVNLIHGVLKYYDTDDLLRFIQK
ncbi:MAG: acetylxylan esterase [Planctomycetia bacterium]|nr:acetylxylan esterase [Planctomycetia bacterium]